MRCPKCGYALPEDSEFCQYCGSKLSAEGENIASPDIPIVELPNSADVRQTIQESPKASDIEDTFPPKEENDSSNSAAALENNCTVPTPDTIGLTAVPPETSVDNQKKKFCKFCGGLIDADTKKCSSCGKQFLKFPKRIVGVIALVIVFVALAGLNIYQYVSNDARLSDLEEQLKANSTTIAGLEQQIKTKDSTISTQKSTIATQKNTIAELGEKGEYYDDICTALKSGNIGGASNNFKVSDGVIVVDKDRTKQVTLTTTYGGGGTISVDYDGFTALVSFDDDTWYNTTTLTIDPWAEGVTVATFSNDVNAQTFKMIIIVTD